MVLLHHGLLPSIYTSAYFTTWSGLIPDHISIFYKNLRILDKLTDLYRLELATFMYKAKKKTIPMAFQSLFLNVTEVYERTRRASTSSKILLPYYKTSKLQRSIKYQRSLLWNSLSLDIQNSSSVKVFRLKYKNSSFLVLTNFAFVI